MTNCFKAMSENHNAFFEICKETPIFWCHRAEKGEDQSQDCTRRVVEPNMSTTLQSGL